MARTIDKIIGIAAAAFLASALDGVVTSAPILTQAQHPVTAAKEKIPSPVLEKYDNFPSIFIRRRIGSCKKGDDTVYMVVRSTGYVANVSYYSKSGNYLGDLGISDQSASGARPKPPVNLKDYVCTDIKHEERR